jgi:propionate CoA-transferase
VFELKPGGGDDGQGRLELIEIAPGINLERDVLAQMDFMPVISPQLRLMDAALFLDEPIGLRHRLLATPLAQRFELDRAHGMLFINFEGLGVDSAADIEAIEQQITALLAPLEPLGERVAAVVNYDSFSILPRLIDDYSAMVQRLSARYYSRVTRYGTGGFLKARLEALRPAAG